MTGKPATVLMPTEVSSRIGFFDRFAGLAATIASRAPFFAVCLLLVLVWLVQGVALGRRSRRHPRGARSPVPARDQHDDDHHHLPVGRAPAEQPDAERQATQHKLNAIADGLADLMAHLAAQDPDSSLVEDMKELRAAVGLESREGTSGNAS